MSETAPKTLHVTVRMGDTKHHIHTFKVNSKLRRTDELVTALSQIGSNGQGLCTVSNRGGTCTIKVTVQAASKRNPYAHRIFGIVAAIGRTADVRLENTTLDFDKLMGDMTLSEFRDRLYESDKYRNRQAGIKRKPPAAKAS